MRDFMDDSRFDELTKGLGASSRRGLLAAAGTAALAALFGREAVDEALAKKKKKKKKPCKGQRCGDKCIPSRACCTSARRGTWIPEGEESGQCGICIGGKITKDEVECILIDPEGCTVCNDSFECVPAPNGTLCEGCGTCNDGFCEDPDETRQCGDSCCSGPNPFCVDPDAGLCCEEDRACDSECCQADSGFGNDGEVCTRDGCCLQVKAASNCRADHDDQEPCTEKICCAHVWTQEGRGLTCNPGAEVPPETRAYCCGPGKSCCFTGCCPDGSSCCGNGTCCPTGAACGSAACFAPVPDHV
jgi:hypothetical protein